MQSHPVRIFIVVPYPAVARALRLCLEEFGWSEHATVYVDEHASATDASDFLTMNIQPRTLAGLDLPQEVQACKNIKILLVLPQDDLIASTIPTDTQSTFVRFDEAVSYITEKLDHFRGNIENNQTIIFDQHTFDLNRRVARRLDGSLLDLTEMELKILELFLRRPGRVISRDEIFQVLHGRDWSPMDRTIDGHIARLRKKIPQSEGSPMLIQSVRGIGYIFAGDVTLSPSPAPKG